MAGVERLRSRFFTKAFYADEARPLQSEWRDSYVGGGVLILSLTCPGVAATMLIFR